MPKNERDVVRQMLLDELLRKVEADHYPSPTMLDVIESLLTEDDLARYAQLLLSHIEQDLYPSIPLIRRIHQLAA